MVVYRYPPPWNSCAAVLHLGFVSFFRGWMTRHSASALPGAMPGLRYRAAAVLIVEFHEQCRAANADRLVSPRLHHTWSHTSPASLPRRAASASTTPRPIPPWSGLTTMSWNTRQGKEEGGTERRREGNACCCLLRFAGPVSLSSYSRLERQPLTPLRVFILPPQENSAPQLVHGCRGV